MGLYIQEHPDFKGLPINSDTASALYGANFNPNNTCFIKIEELEKLSGDDLNVLRSDLFVGSVEFMRVVFDKLGIKPSLPANTNRPHEVMTFGEYLKLVEQGTVRFIKPKQIKLFTGIVADTIVCNGLKTHIPLETELLVYIPFPHPIVTEWRFYIGRNQIIDCANYAGRRDIFPNKEYVKGVLQDFCRVAKFPSNFIMDVAVLADGSSRIVEFNDAWAVANYGIDNREYFSLLHQRYFEILFEHKAFHKP